jgi:guanylate kinase
MHDPNRRGLLIILSSPSGAGKSTLARRLMAWDDTLRFSVSATTRAPRTGEIDGEDYHFLDEPRFKAMVRDGEMLEHAHVFGNFYGSPMRRRLESRGQDDAETIAKRMQKSWDEISHWDGYDYVLVNGDLDATERRLKTIITAERMKASQQPALMDHVRQLQSEFEDTP